MSSKIIRSTFFFGVTLCYCIYFYIYWLNITWGSPNSFIYWGNFGLIFAIILTANWDYKNLGETFNRPMRAIVISFIFLGIMSYIIFNFAAYERACEKFCN